MLTGPQRFGARLAVDADGTLWIAFNGEPITTLPGPLDSRWHAGSNGDALGALSFDGTTWRHYLDRHLVNRIALAEDGSVWATSLYACSETAECEYDDARAGGLYVITPAGVAGIE